MRELSVLLLCCVVTFVHSVRPPPPPKFELDGACAGVKQRETWKSANGQPNWTYRIKVSPWTVFGRIRVQLHGWDMTVTKNYSAAVEAAAGRDFVAVLHPQPGLDDTFQIQGTGEPYADPDISCEGLVERNATVGDCPLGPRFMIESDWASLQSGRIRASVEVNLWVLQTIITIDFGSSNKVTIGRDIYGARLTDEGDGKSSKAIVSLLPRKNCLGMYKDKSCDNVFGFSATVSPSMKALPTISCLLTREMPTPPPPSPPGPPPSPPPGFTIDPNLCYLGGSAHFIVAPHKVAAQAALQTWIVAIHLDKWQVGLRVVLDFPGVMHAEHGLHVHSVHPAEVARLVSVTRHSAIVELLTTAARDFRLEALGDVSEVRVVCDIGDARPPPPPPPLPPAVPSKETTGSSTGEQDSSASGRSTQQGQEAVTPTIAVEAKSSGMIQGQNDPPPMASPPPPPAPVEYREGFPWGLVISIGLMAYIGHHALQAQKDSEPYMIKAAEHIRWARTYLAKTPFGKKVLLKITTSSIGGQIMQIEHRYLGLPGSVSSGPDAGIKPAALAKALEKAEGNGSSTDGKVVKARKGKGKGSRQTDGDDEELEEQGMPLVGQPSLEGFDDSDEEEEEEEKAGEEPEPPPVKAKAKAKGPKDKGKTELVVKVGGSERKRDVDLRDVRDMADLQRAVAKVCKSMGTDVSGGLRMQYTDASGHMQTVSRSTPIGSVCNARQLVLTPKAPRGSSGSSSSRHGNGDLERGMMDD